MRHRSFACVALACTFCLSAGCAWRSGSPVVGAMPLDKAAEVEPVIIVNAPARQQTLAVGAGDALGRAMFDHYVALVRAQRQDRLLREQRVAGVSDSH